MPSALHDFLQCQLRAQSFEIVNDNARASWTSTDSTSSGLRSSICESTESEENALERWETKDLPETHTFNEGLEKGPCLVCPTRRESFETVNVVTPLPDYQTALQAIQQRYAGGVSMPPSRPTRQISVDRYPECIREEDECTNQ